MSDRIITGICTTPTVDAHGQSATTSGYRWAAPIPLRVDHRGPKVGTVTKLRREGVAIHFEAKVEDDEVWQRIEDGELLAASIEVKDTKSEKNDDGVLIIKEGEIREVSVCAEGANPDCRITIPSLAPVYFRAAPTAARRRGARAPREWVVKDMVEPVYPAGARQRGDTAALRAARQAFIDYHVNFRSKCAQERGINPSNLVTNELLFTALGQVEALLAWAAIRMAEAEERIAGIEAGQQVFRGTHQRALGYAKGSLVTHDGSLWVALVDVPQGASPGKSDAWQLAVKRGDAG